MANTSIETATADSNNINVSQFAAFILWRVNEQIASESIVGMCYEGVMVILGTLGNALVI
jgi:hypothetical protein